MGGACEGNIGLRFIMKSTARSFHEMIVSAFDQQYRLDAGLPRGPLARAVMSNIAFRGKGKGRGKGGKKGQ